MNDKLTTCRDIDALATNSQKACRLFLAECKKHGLDVLITETYRSQARQDYLYAQGRTRAGKKVTWTKNSRHTSRRAWDVCKNVKGGEYSDEGFFRKCGAVAKKLGIIWGGDWSTPDMPHFEVDTQWKYEGDDIDMDELERLKQEFAKYVEHTSGIINTMGREISCLQNIINIMGREIAELKAR